MRSHFDLSVIGLKLVEKQLYPDQRPLVISNMGELKGDRNYVDNQTMLSSSEGYYFKKNIGLFKSSSGDKINVFIDHSEVDSDFARTLLNYPIACAFYQKKIFSLHASVVTFNNKIIIFPGSALTGKSTIAAYFLKRGGKLITEDTAVIEIQDGRAFVRSSYPFIKLSSSANKVLSFSSSDGILLRTDRNKRLGHILNEKSFCAKRAPIDYCILLEYGDHEAVTPIASSHAILELMRASLNVYPLTEIKQRELFHWSAMVARAIKTFRFYRRRGILLSQFLVDFIEQEKS